MGDARPAADRFHSLRLAQLISSSRDRDVVDGREDRALVAEVGDRAERLDLDHFAVLADAAKGKWTLGALTGSRRAS